jgi:hypothetical protein
MKKRFLKKYVIEQYEKEDGETYISKKNIGFLSYELLGLLYWNIDDIKEQMKGKIRPDIVKRKVIKKK